MRDFVNNKDIKKFLKPGDIVRYQYEDFEGDFQSDFYIMDSENKIRLLWGFEDGCNPTMVPTMVVTTFSLTDKQINSYFTEKTKWVVVNINNKFFKYSKEVYEDNSNDNFSKIMFT